MIGLKTLSPYWFLLIWGKQWQEGQGHKGEQEDRVCSLAQSEPDFRGHPSSEASPSPAPADVRNWKYSTNWKWKPMLHWEQDGTLIQAGTVFSVCIGYQTHVGFPGGSHGEESACSAGDLGLIPGLGRSPREGNGYPIQYSCLEKSMDRGAWWATVHGIAKSWTWLSDKNTHTNTHTHQTQGGWLEGVGGMVG